jgi:ribonuclease P protein component
MEEHSDQRDPSGQEQRLVAGEVFPKSARLLKRAEYLAVQGRGRKYHGEHFLLLLGPRGSISRVGVTVSSKVGNAVVRNRLKRWVREYLRRHRVDLPLAEMVLVAKPSAAAVAHPVIDADLAGVLRKTRGARG